jgi:hypothetical protein
MDSIARDDELRRTLRDGFTRARCDASLAIARTLSMRGNDELLMHGAACSEGSRASRFAISLASRSERWPMGGLMS